MHSRASNNKFNLEWILRKLSHTTDGWLLAQPPRRRFQPRSRGLLEQPHSACPSTKESFKTIRNVMKKHKKQRITVRVAFEVAARFHFLDLFGCPCFPSPSEKRNAAIQNTSYGEADGHCGDGPASARASVFAALSSFASSCAFLITCTPLRINMLRYSKWGLRPILLLTDGWARGGLEKGLCL